jgi:tetratricopeptide (TPR) repeat protein
MKLCTRGFRWVGPGAAAAAVAIAVAVLCLTIAIPAARSQQRELAPTATISVESSAQIFATMCALDAAGYDADESTLAEMPERLALRGDLLKAQGPAADAVRQFYRDHALADPGETLSRYITFALSIGAPPHFAYEYDHDLLPPDVLTIENFQPLLANFYREAHLGARWAQIEPEYDGAIARYQSPVRRIVTTSDAYLREILRPETGRTFTVFVEPLVGNRTNFRNFGDHYAIVVGTGQELAVEQIQHAYLHYLLDPLPLKFRKEVEAKSALLQIAAHAPLLPPEYQSDFIEYTDESLIKAVELRLRNLPPDKLEAALKEEDETGFILVRPLMQQLHKFEKSEPSMSYYFPDLIGGVDVVAEQKRLQNFTFAKLPTAPAPAAESTAAAAPVSAVDQLLAEGDRQIGLRNAEGAEAAFQKVLNQDPNQPHALYGLAVASLMLKKGDRAMENFQAVVSLAAKPAAVSPPGEPPAEPMDPSILAWSHVYLGRLHDLEDERDQAVAEYRAGLAVEGAPEAARVAAQRGLDEAYKPHSAGSETKPQKP